jgi:hypothetical protein
MAFDYAQADTAKHFETISSISWTFLGSRIAVGSNSISHKLIPPQTWLFFFLPLPLQILKLGSIPRFFIEPKPVNQS